jgi:NAD(P)-dependent dehydrogenase (short-subunit alcohol dehydrogenase family)
VATNGTSGTSRLKGKVAIVTGGGTSGKIVGTGRAISEVFAREGAAVTVVDRDPKAAEKTLKVIKAAGGKAISVLADVASEADCKRCADETMAAFGRLDIVVNNVGVDNKSGHPRIIEITEEEWDRLMDVNLKGVLMMAKHSIPLMTNGGSIINISSIASIRPGPDTVYTAAKGGMEHLSRSIAAQYGDRQIRSNVIRPGEIWTSLIATAFPEEELPIVREKRINRSLLKTEGTAYDIATAALFFASDDARWVTGQILTVDGGITLFFDRQYHPRTHWQFGHR